MINRRTIVRALVPDVRISVCNKDAQLMDEFLKSHSISDAVLPASIPRKKVVPGGVPLLDLERAYCRKEDTWKLPGPTVLDDWGKSRGMEYGMLASVDIREIIIGATPDQKVREIQDWAADMMKADSDCLPTGVIPIVVKPVKITTHDVVRIARMKTEGQELVLQKSLRRGRAQVDDELRDCNGKLFTNGWINIPGKIILGNGRTWAVVISFDIRYTHEKSKFIYHGCPDSVVTLLKSFPPVVGYDVKESVLLIENMLPKLGFPKFNMKGFIELQSLAVAAGWRHGSLSRVALSMILLGVPVNLISGNGDKLWGRRWGEIEKSLRVMLIFDIKWTEMIYSTLLIALREEIMPDPDVMGLITGALQDELAVWWSRWIAHTLVGVFIDLDAYHAAKSRHETMRALRGIGEDGRLLPSAPYRVELLLELVEDGTTITRGGARFLHIERERALRTSQIFALCPLYGFDRLFLGAVPKEVMLKVRYGQHSIASLDRRAPVPHGSEKLLLVAHESLSLPPVHLELDDIRLESVLAVFNRARRAPREGIPEWARLNLGGIDRFMVAYTKEKAFARKFRSVYEDVRMIKLRVVNVHAITVPECEDLFARHQLEELTERRDEIVALRLQLATLQDQVQGVVEELSHMEDVYDYVETSYRRGRGIDRSQWRVPLKERENVRRQHRELPLDVHARDLAGGVPRGVRVLDQEEAPVPRFPVRRTSAEGKSSGWLDDDEDRSRGRAVPSPGKRREDWDTEDVEILVEVDDE